MTVSQMALPALARREGSPRKLWGGRNTRTEKRAKGRALIAMKKRRRPSLDLDLSDALARRGFVTPSKRRLAKAIAPMTVNTQRMFPWNRKEGNILVASAFSGGI